MNKRRFERLLFLVTITICAAGLAGCSTVGTAAADLGLAGAGGVAGYQVSGHRVGGAAAGAAVGYLASRVAQSEIQKDRNEAEQRGYDRALNQAVKQQYWIIQNQQRSRETPADPDVRLVPIVIPETKINGVVQAAHVEYLRLQP